MSATIGEAFLATTDRKKDGLHDVVPFDPELDEDGNEDSPLNALPGSIRVAGLHPPVEVAPLARTVHRPGHFRFASDSLARGDESPNRELHPARNAVGRRMLTLVVVLSERR
jgi:hypothetical protein